MKVRFAKQVFCEKAMVEQVASLGERLSCDAELAAVSNMGGGGARKSYVEVTKERLRVIKEKASAAGEEASKEVKEDVAWLEFTIHVHVIYIYYLMNKDMKVSKDNVDEVEADLKQSLKFFKEWRQHSLTLKEANDPGWERSFISNTTYKNMRICVSGFITYCRIVLSLPNPPQYVPFLHSNTSSLEATFSHLKSMGATTATMYVTAITTINARTSIRILNQVNEMYEGDDGEVGINY